MDLVVAVEDEGRLGRNKFLIGFDLSEETNYIENLRCIVVIPSECIYRRCRMKLEN